MEFSESFRLIADYTACVFGWYDSPLVSSFGLGAQLIIDCISASVEPPTT